MATPSPVPPTPFSNPPHCDNVQDCFPCFVLPTTNTSAETPDFVLPFSLAWGNLQNNLPPLNTLFLSTRCGLVCESTISQADADLCAARLQTQCIVRPGPPPPDPPPNLNPPAIVPPTVPPLPPPPNIFSNNTATCTVNCPDGLPFSFTVPAGQFIARTQAQADSEAHSYACREARAHLICINSNTTQICLGAVNAQLVFVATGDFLTDSNIWDLDSGTLPNGFSFTSAIAGTTLTLTGTPGIAGSSTFSLRVTAPNGDFMVKQFSVCVLDIIPNNLPSASLGAPYSQQMGSTSCGQLFTWEILQGSLPPGLTLDPVSGILSGMPTVPGTYNFEIAASTAF